MRCPVKEHVIHYKKINIFAKDNSPYFKCYEYSSENISKPVNQNHDWLLSVLNNAKDMESSWQEKPSLDVFNSAEKTIKNDKKMVTLNEILDDLNVNYKFLPLQCFVNTENKQLYKVWGDELFSFVKNIEGDDFHFVIKLVADLSNRNPQRDINEFEQEIRENHQKELDKDFWRIITLTSPLLIMGITFVSIPIIAILYVLYKKHHIAA
jgi:hypothetical protein